VKEMVKIATPHFSKPRKTRFALGDLILMVLYTLRGLEPTDLIEIFGGGEQSIANGVKIGFDTINRFGHVFRYDCPTESEALAMSTKLREDGRPCPESLFIGDCMDLPIWSQDGDDYTYKRGCPSTHAIRVRKNTLF
jgi:hypothetical protein